MSPPAAAWLPRLSLVLLAPLLTLGVLLRSSFPAGGPAASDAAKAAEAGPGPLDHRHLALVINSADPLSEEIGTAYQRARSLPQDQVIRVRFAPGRPQIDPAAFQLLRAQVLRATPSRVQIYALAWPAPYRVGCQSITSAFTFGLDRRWCAWSCHATRLSPYFARGEVRRPWDELGIRPTMLLAATSAEQARRLIARGVAADGTAPAGTAYLLSTSDRARNTRLEVFLRAAARQTPDFRVRLLESDALVGAPDVMAYFTGLAKVRHIATNRFLPGAVADHLTSFGGRLTDSPQMSALSWLEAGATGSYGTVVEPCNLPEKFPDPALLLGYYRRGDTLIEAYWRSVAMPGQGLFIGEPLARPWASRGIQQRPLSGSFFPAGTAKQPPPTGEGAKAAEEKGADGLEEIVLQPE